MANIKISDMPEATSLSLDAYVPVIDKVSWVDTNFKISKPNFNFAAWVGSVNTRTWAVTLTKADVSLSNVTDDAQVKASIGTAKGDIIWFSSSATPVHLAVGSNGEVLRADSTATTGLKWTKAVKVTTADTTPWDLNDKLTAGDWLTKTTVTPAGNETLDLDIDLTDTTIFVSTSAWAWDSWKVVRLNASWLIPSWFLTWKLGWTWADWAIDWTVAVTITWSNNTYIVKNYTSWAAGTAARILTTTPTNCITHIRIQWDADFSNWTFNYASKWWPWGVGSAIDPDVWGNWTAWIALLSSTRYNGWWIRNSTTGAWGWAWSSADWGAGGSTWWVKTIISETYIQSVKKLFICAWWGWAGSYTAENWWAGGWALLIEVWGNLTLNNSTTVWTFTWWAWTVDSGMGWWWGWGWSLVIIYNWTLTWTFTPTLTWWAWAGWAWAGWAWISVIEKNYTW